MTGWNGRRSHSTKGRPICSMQRERLHGMLGRLLFFHAKIFRFKSKIFSVLLYFQNENVCLNAITAICFCLVDLSHKKRHNQRGLTIPKKFSITNA